MPHQFISRKVFLFVLFFGIPLVALITCWVHRMNMKIVATRTKETDL